MQWTCTYTIQLPKLSHTYVNWLNRSLVLLPDSQNAEQKGKIKKGKILARNQSNKIQSSLVKDAYCKTFHQVCSWLYQLLFKVLRDKAFIGIIPQQNKNWYFEVHITLAERGIHDILLTRSSMYSLRACFQLRTWNKKNSVSPQHAGFCFCCVVMPIKAMSLSTWNNYWCSQGNIQSETKWNVLK